LDFIIKTDETVKQINDIYEKTDKMVNKWHIVFYF
jgi:hypothetical protein